MERLKLPVVNLGELHPAEISGVQPAEIQQTEVKRHKQNGCTFVKMYSLACLIYYPYLILTVINTSV